MTHSGRTLRALIVLCLVANLVLLPSQPVLSQAAALPAQTTATVVIHFDGASFVPANVTVAIGDTIEWWNDTATAQTLEATGVLIAVVTRIYLPLVLVRRARGNKGRKWS